MPAVRRRSGFICHRPNDDSARCWKRQQVQLTLHRPQKFQFTPRGHTHLDLRYLLHGDDTDPSPPPDESQEVAWYSWADAGRVTESCMTGIVTYLSTMY